MDTRHTVPSGSTTDTPFSHAHENMITIPLIEYNLLLLDRATAFDRDAVAKERKDTVRSFHTEIEKSTIKVHEQNTTIMQLLSKNESLNRQIEDLKAEYQKRAAKSRDNTGLKTDTPSADDYKQLCLENAKLEKTIQSLSDSMKEQRGAHVNQLREMKKMYDEAKSEYQEKVDRLHKDAELERCRVLQLTQDNNAQQAELHRLQSLLKDFAQAQVQTQAQLLHERERKATPASPRRSSRGHATPADLMAPAAPAPAPAPSGLDTAVLSLLQTLVMRQSAIDEQMRALLSAPGTHAPQATHLHPYTAPATHPLPLSPVTQDDSEELSEEIEEVRSRAQPSRARADRRGQASSETARMQQELKAKDRAIRELVSQDVQHTTTVVDNVLARSRDVAQRGKPDTAPPASARNAASVVPDGQRRRTSLDDTMGEGDTTLDGDLFEDLPLPSPPQPRTAAAKRAASAKPDAAETSRGGRAPARADKADEEHDVSSDDDSVAVSRAQEKNAREKADKAAEKQREKEEKEREKQRKKEERERAREEKEREKEEERQRKAAEKAEKERQEAAAKEKASRQTAPKPTAAPSRPRISRAADETDDEDAFAAPRTGKASTERQEQPKAKPTRATSSKRKRLNEDTDEDASEREDAGKRPAADKPAKAAAVERGSLSGGAVRPRKRSRAEESDAEEQEQEQEEQAEAGVDASLRREGAAKRRLAARTAATPITPAVVSKVDEDKAAKKRRAVSPELVPSKPAAASIPSEFDFDAMVELDQLSAMSDKPAQPAAKPAARRAGKAAEDTPRVHMQVGRGRRGAQAKPASETIMEGVEEHAEPERPAASSASGANSAPVAPPASSTTATASAAATDVPATTAAAAAPAPAPAPPVTAPPVTFSFDDWDGEVVSLTTDEEGVQLSSAVVDELDVRRKIGGLQLRRKSGPLKDEDVAVAPRVGLTSTLMTPLTTGTVAHRPQLTMSAFANRSLMGGKTGGSSVSGIGGSSSLSKTGSLVGDIASSKASGSLAAPSSLPSSLSTASTSTNASTPSSSASIAAPSTSVPSASAPSRGTGDSTSSRLPAQPASPAKNASSNAVSRATGVGAFSANNRINAAGSTNPNKPVLPKLKPK